MTLLISRLSSFVGRHWLRLLIVGGALFLLSDKQVNLSVRLGGPRPPATTVPAAPQNGVTPPVAPTGTARTPILSDTDPITETAEVTPEKASFLERFNPFGNNEPRYFDLLVRQEEPLIAAFLRRFSNVAQAEQDKYGVPASLTLASALLYGRAGQAAPARQHNNYFGLGCDDDWPGATGHSGGHCYRAYENAWTSFRDHSLYVTSGRFAALTQFGRTDYRRWAKGLEELDFNDTEDLAEQLMRTIDKYALFQFD